MLSIKVDVEGLVSSVETVIDNTLRPHTTGSLLMNTTKTVEAHFKLVASHTIVFSILKLGLNSD